MSRSARLSTRTWALALLSCLAAVLCLASCTAETTPSAPATPKRTLPVTTPAVTPVPAHVATLTAALRKMKQTHNATLLGSPGAADILDYGIGDLWQQGIDGTGTTIALVGAWDDPNINLAALRIDQEWGLPAPDITTIYPTGTGHLPAKCPAPMVALGFYGSCDGWAGELELDVESAHLVAPYARILIVVAPPDSEIADDDASQVAPPEMMRAVEYVSDHHLADVVSISDDTGESTYSYHKPELTAQDPGELVAAAAGIPLLVGTGDCGVVQNLAVASSQCGNTSARPDTAAWDDSPWVTAVGGSVPDLDPATGAHRGPDRVWSEGRAAEGAGHSGVYARPDYQSQVADGTMRSVPDITMDARLGTSESTPLFGGVLALAAQLNHGGVGPINNALYEILGPKGTQAGITDVVTGNNSVTTAPGLSAHAGFDVATGWGTIDASRFVPALVAAVRAEEAKPHSPRQQAAAALTALRKAAHLSSTTIAAGASSSLAANGFLPKHPVRLAIDGHPVTTLTANAVGAVGYVVDPGTPRLTPGPHSLTLTSMLITDTTTFTSH